MDLEQKSLSYWIASLDSMHRDIWLWVRLDTEQLHLSTECYAIKDDIDLLSSEEREQGHELERQGLKCFLNKELLEDIVNNLKAQLENYAQDDLCRALNYYWENDAFIVVNEHSNSM